MNDFALWMVEHPVIHFVCCTVALNLLVKAWINHRRAVKAQIAANQAGAFCPHGVRRPKNCRPCNEAFLKDDLPKDQPKIVISGASYTPADPVVPVQFVPDGSPVEGSPLVIQVPVGVDLVLKLTTDDSWSGPVELAAERTHGGAYCSFHSFWVNISKGRNDCYYVNVSQQLGPAVTKLVIPDKQGLVRVQVIANGSQLVDAAPAALRAAQRFPAALRAAQRFMFNRGA